MSRSYKKQPVYKATISYGKKISNRIVRRKLKYLDIGSSKCNIYKKLFNSYNVCDYKFRYTEQDYINKTLALTPDYEEQELRMQWYKWYKRK